MSTYPTVTVVGAGLAGSEAAWQLAQAGVPVRLVEMRPQTATAAHKTGACAELVCSNSFRSDDHEANAVGVLHEEMRRAGGLVMRCAAAHRVPAGSALAVDREGFAEAVTRAIDEHPLISRSNAVVESLPPAEDGPVIVATGPLTHPTLAEDIRRVTGEDALAFFDAIAPIVHCDTIDMSVAWRQSRYDKSGPDGSGADYINCPLDASQYDRFIAELGAAEPMPFRDWERDTPYFEGCLPIEEMARRGPQTLRFGPMKPVGLTNAHAPDRKPHAVVQLRQDNALGTLYNMVGFQTKLKYAEQVRVFRTIPGLENAEFARLGGIHRNTFLNSPKLLDPTLRLRGRDHIRFAGQMTGCEGYVESAAIGGLAARFLAAELRGLSLDIPPDTTAHGALLAHITGGHLGGTGSFQPMNVNFGLFRPLEPADLAAQGPKGKARGREKKKLIACRALIDFEAWVAATALPQAA